MGQTCTTCCTTAEETQGEINDFKTKTPQMQKSVKTVKSSQKTDMEMIIRVQALVRGFIQRRKYRVKQLTADQASKYFKSSEASETVTNKKFDMAGPSKNKVHTYRTGSIFTGQWKGGLRHGQGTMVWADNARYEGQWQYNAASGKGKFFHTDGDVYDGEWLNNKANGFGVYTNIKGARYEGQWLQDQQHGKGIETWPEGAKYEGDYVQSRKEGYGLYTWADGSTYEGQWADNKINGHGVYFWKDGRKYYGQWSNNDMQGHGIYIYADGVRFDGQYFQDKKEGYGIYFWTDGRKYEGYWHQGKQHGLGIYYDPTKGTLKHGIWQYGKRLKWFDDQTITQINQKNVDVGSLFEDSQAAAAFPANATFQKPRGFDEAMQSIKKILKIQFK